MKPISLLALVFLYACSEHDTRTLLIMNNGRELYTTHCSNCHQAGGEGVKGIVPPLKDADYLHAHAAGLPCIIRYGMKGDLQVNGHLYKGYMPGNKKLSDREIVFITNYVLQAFSSPAQFINMDSNEFEPIFKPCKQ